MLGEDGQLFGQQMVKEYKERTRDHVALTYDGSEAVGHWGRVEIPVGRKLPEPSPLFQKLDPSVAEVELARLGAD